MVIASRPNPPTQEQVISLRILAIHAGMHDSSAAAFDDYEMVAAVSEERLTPREGLGRERALALDRRGAAHRGLAAQRCRRDRDHARLVSDASLHVSAVARAAVHVRTLARTRAHASRARGPEPSLRHHRYAQAVPRRPVPERQLVPAGHADLFREPSRERTRSPRCSTPTGTRRWSIRRTASATMSATRCAV